MGNTLQSQRIIENAICVWKAVTVYHVQIGAFSNYQNCFRLKNEINALPDAIKAGYSKAYIKQTGNLYKLHVGVFSVKENAQRVIDDLKSKGYPAFVTTE